MNSQSFLRAAAACLAALFIVAAAVRPAQADGSVLLPPWQAESPPRLTARAALLMDLTTGQVLYEREGLQRLAPASTTKIMTAIVALELGGGRLDEVVTVSKNAAQLGGSTMRLRAGDQYTLEELLAGLLLRSGNDASVAIAEHLAGSTEAFVALMNEKAIELGASATRFANPHGLDHPDHYTTPYDLALITRHAMGLPLFAQLVATRERRVDKEQRPESWMLNNTNRLLWTYEAADGVKTGTTGQAGNCLVATATRDGQQLIAVVMNAGDRWTDSTKLFDWGFDQFELVRHASAGQEVGAAPLRRGKSREVPLRLGEDVTVVVPRNAVGLLRTEIELHGSPEAPVYEGQPLGTMYIYAGELLAGDAPLVAAQSVRRRGLWPWLLELFGFGP